MINSFGRYHPAKPGGTNFPCFSCTHFSDLANFFCGREEWWRLTVSESLKEGGIPLVEKTK